MAPRGPTVLTNPPEGLFRTAPDDPYPILNLSTKVRPGVPRLEQESAFTRLAAKAIHRHFPNLLSPESYLLEHAPYTIPQGYMRVSFTIQHPEAVDSLLAATSSTNTLQLPPPTMLGCIAFEAPRVSWTNLTVSYTRQLVNVPPQMDVKILTRFLSTENCKCHFIKAVKGASGSATKGRYLVKFTVGSVTHIPPSYQVQGPDGSSYKIDVRMPSPIPTTSMIDLDTDRPLPPMAAPWTSLAQQIPISPPIPTPDPATIPAPSSAFTFSPPSHARDRPRKDVKKARRLEPKISAYEALLEQRFQEKKAKQADFASRAAQAAAEHAVREQAATAKAAKEKAAAKYAALVKSAAAQIAATGTDGAGPSGHPPPRLLTRPTPSSAGNKTGATADAATVTAAIATTAAADAAGAAAPAVQTLKDPKPTAVLPPVPRFSMRLKKTAAPALEASLLKALPPDADDALPPSASDSEFTPMSEDEEHLCSDDESMEDLDPGELEDLKKDATVPIVPPTTEVNVPNGEVSPSST